MSTPMTTFGSRARRSGTLIAGVIILLLIVAAALAAPWLTPYSPTTQDLSGGLKPPSPEHWFGTDQLGRDVLSRVLFAARTDLWLAFVAALLPGVIGVTAGLISGYFGRRTDWVISRVVDTVIAFPFYVIVIAIAFALGAGQNGIIVAFAIVGWVGYARVIGTLTASMREQEWVQAARGSGLGHARVLIRHVLPNVLPQALVLFMNEVLLIMVAIVTLGYLGLGIQPPTPDWGTMIAEAQPFVATKWWLAALPGLAVVVTGVGLSLTADGLGDALRVRGAGDATAGAGSRLRWCRRRSRTDAHTHPSAARMQATATVPAGIVEVVNLTVGRLRPRGGALGDDDLELVRGVSFSIAPGKTLGIVGESGSGKSLTLRAMLGIMPSGAYVSGGRVLVGGRVSMVFQDPQTALDPLSRVGVQLGEAIEAANRDAEYAAIDRRTGKAERTKRVLELLDLVRLQDAARIARAYPHELSGGQRQRIVIAMALAGRPDVLLCDEPTTALDVTVQQEVLQLLRELQRTRNLTLVFVSHDLAVVASMCENVAVMQHGHVIEAGPTAEILNTPHEAYTRQLLSAVLELPVLGQVASSPVAPQLGMIVADAESLISEGLAARSVGIRYGREQCTVWGVDFDVPQGGALGIVGESGSGKTTLARALVGQLPLASGTLMLNGTPLTVKRSRALLREIQLVPQDPTSSLNPRMRVGEVLTEVLARQAAGRGRNPAGARELLARVQLDPDLASRYPHELSGGQKQRVAIARALAAAPKVLIADEPTSALDASVRADIIALLHRLRAELGLTLVLISHDLAVVHELCDAVIVMRQGRLVEAGGREFFTSPQSAYGQKLVSAVPRL